MTTTQKLCNALSKHLKYGGVTMSPEGEIITSGIAVALSKHSEHIVPYKSNEYVKGYIYRWLETISGKNALGFWVDSQDNDTVYLDEVRVFPDYDLKEAVLWAIQHNQLAIQLLDPNVTLRIER